MSDDMGKAADAAGKASDDAGQKQRNIDFDALKSERDEAKRRLRELEEAEKKRKEDELKAQSKYEELLKQRESELAAERAEKESLKKKAEAYDANDKALRESALTKLTDEKLRDIASELSTPKLLAFVEAQSQQQPGGGAPKGKPAGGDKADMLKPKPGESIQDFQKRVQAEYRRPS